MSVRIKQYLLTALVAVVALIVSFPFTAILL